MDDRHERGMKIYAESFGVPEADLRDAFNHRVGSIYAEEAILSSSLCAPTRLEPPSRPCRS